MPREIHIAGPLVDLVQRCAQCGDVLTDYRNAMYPDGDPPSQGWAVGAHVEVDRGWLVQWWLTEDAATCEVVPADSVEEQGLL